MKGIKESTFSRYVALIVTIGVFILTIVPRDTFAYVISGEAQALTRHSDLQRIDNILQTEAIKERLERLGLSMEEIQGKLKRLSDEELHRFANQLESIYPGGGVLGVVAAVLIIIILVLVLFKITGHKIIIK